MRANSLAGRIFAIAGAGLCLALPLLAGPEPAPPELRLPATAEPTGYAVDLAIDPGQQTFRGAVDIEIRVKEKTSLLWLSASDLTITKATANAGGKTLGVRAVPGGESFAGFAFDKPLSPGGLKLHVEYTGKVDENSTQGVFRQKDGNDWYVFTQFETTDARRAFPCFDEPSYKVKWQLTLRIPSGTTAVSNTPIELESSGADGARVVRFKKTEPLPSYLVAFGVGPFEYLDAGKAGAKKTPIRIVTPRGKASQGRYAAQTTGPLLERLETYFGIPYPYEKLDQLAIPQTVTFSAMENAGLITWSERVLLAPPDEETIRFHRSQASINAHEMAHQWFGDLVTLAWWDDVWLNESFATWMADRTIIEWKPEWAEDVERVVASSNVMFDDTLVSARKIRQEIKTNDDIVNAFDGISYQKGAAILTMFEAWTGPEKFRAGVHAYLEAHRFGNATEADFLQAIQAATQPGVAAAFSSFLDQPGVPVIAVTLDCAGSSASLTLSQKRLLPLGSTGAEPETWRVPVCARAGSGGQAGRGCSLLTEARGAMPAPGGRCPSWVLANDGELGYYRALYEGDLLRRLIAAADKELTVAERVGVIRDVNALAEAGELPMADALALVPRFANDPSRQIVQATLRIASDIKEHQVAPDRQANYARFVSKMYGQKARALGFTPKPGDDDETRLLRRALLGFVALEGQEPDLQAEARRLSLKWLDDPPTVSADMVADVLEVAGRYGDRALFDRFRAAAKSNPRRRDRARLYSALGSFQDPALLKEAFALTLDPSLDYRETDSAFFAAIGTSVGRATMWDFVQANFDAIVARMPRETTGQIAYVASGFCDAAKEKEAKAFLSGRVEKLPGGPRNLAQTLEGIQLCIASRTAQEPGVGEFLK
ncbi:MAG TPA: M1 family metallopeptidase, partial [Thermoanaerobaculia bacterium]|nr:M1 family metallopeptidase [Thermoanaerobaculia bacterium]